MISSTENPPLSFFKMVISFFLWSLVKSKTLMNITASPLQICSDLVRRVFSPRLTNAAVVQRDTAKSGGNMGKGVDTPAGTK